MIDTTSYVVGVLSDALDVSVQTDIPPERPKRLVMVSQEGDQSDMFLLRPSYAITCWGMSDVDARGIAISALHALTDDALDSKWLSSVDLDGLVRDEWTGTGQARYVMSLSFVFNYDE